jgi:hypothetical protein
MGNKTSVKSIIKNKELQDKKKAFIEKLKANKIKKQGVNNG